MTADPVRFECADGVALVTLDQPPVNALNAAVRNRVIELFDAMLTRFTLVGHLVGAGVVAGGQDQWKQVHSCSSCQLSALRVSRRR